MRTVAVYSDADANAAHVAACDEAVHIGAASPRDSYLRMRPHHRGRQADRRAGHPSGLRLPVARTKTSPQACADAGLVFIGPPARAIAAMGSKSAAKSLMEKAGVPLVPGYHGERQRPALLAREADRIGYPVLIKASAGGGGKGMRRVDDAGRLRRRAGVVPARGEGNSFGDDHVLVERYVTRPRHIEIQVFADTHGNCVYLFERDCSVQRRHQKVLEEAPAPGLIGRAPRRDGRGARWPRRKAVGYVGARHGGVHRRAARARAATCASTSWR